MKRLLGWSGVVALVAMAVGGISAGAVAQESAPQTPFEASGGASWTPHDGEVEFLTELDAASQRVSVSEIGTTAEGRPVHLVQVGSPVPRPFQAARNEPVVLIACSQHGNEPAGREACLKWIRDLAYTTDPELVQQLRGMTILFVPSANPDGRAENTRGNTTGTDINRDHLLLTQPEAQAMAAVVRDWKPDVSLDLHEYGPSQPVLYDDEVLYLWPRNLNTDDAVHDLGLELAATKIEQCSEAAGYTADEYGQQKVGDIHVAQTAGDEDEGIMRNAMGLRHSIGILVETRVDSDLRNGPDEVLSNAAVQLRRVQAHVTVVDCVLEFVRDNVDEIKAATDQAPLNKAEEGRTQSAPLYFYGADNDEPAASEMQDPPPCAYLLTPEQEAENATQFELHGIETVDFDGETYVPLGQAAEPIIPLLLDDRARRATTAATPLDSVPWSDDCGLKVNGNGPPTQPMWLLGGLVALTGGLWTRKRL